mgnify:CR=1 FL=1
MYRLAGKDVYYGGISISFNWRNYLELAIELQKETDEANLRSSISRAYYAAFCSARNYMEEKDRHELPSDGSEHQYIIDYYSGHKGRSTNRKRTQIAQDLMRMRRERVNADYHNIFVNGKFLPKTAKDVLIWSENVLSLTERGGL